MSPPILIEHARAHPERIAVVEADGEMEYGELLARSARVAAGLLAGAADLDQARVAVLVRPGADWVATCWGIWRAGGVAVPLAAGHPVPEIAALIEDARPTVVVAGEDCIDEARRAAAECRLNTPGELARSPTAALPELDPSRRAMMVYTSGTTGRAKGVVTTHAQLLAQVATLVDAWEWHPHDRILHVLPLHHVHGIVNALCCCLWAGACCEFMVPFDTARAWRRLASGEITVFMAVPTIYGRLVRAWEEADPGVSAQWSAGASRVRLMVSGSAALPTRTLERWEAITGHRLLERYGMTEIGMALGNPLHGERRAGTVGIPFPGVEARIVDDQGRPLTAGSSGEIEIRGPQVFLEYWQRPDETAAAFRDGWFRTGDEGILDDGYWRIAGRRSVDIIKTGGYKVSAPEIEEALRAHDRVADVAVVGVDDADWGERVCAAVVAVGTAPPEPEDLRVWCKGLLAPYKVPKQIQIVVELPRNSLGKVLKPQLRDRFTRPDPGA